MVIEREPLAVPHDGSILRAWRAALTPNPLPEGEGHKDAADSGNRDSYLVQRGAGVPDAVHDLLRFGLVRETRLLFVPDVYRVVANAL